MLRSSALAVGALLALTAQAPALVPLCTKVPLPAAPACRPLVVQTPHGALRLAIAATDAQRERGLMFVPYVPRAQGMIFVFRGDDNRDFWMKNTVVPLDMVFVRADGTITDVAVAVPATPARTPDEKVARRSGVGQYVIELGSGQAGAMGLLPGTSIVIPPVQLQ